MVREFLQGMRVRYFRPVQMLLCLVAVYTILAYIFSGISMPLSALKEAMDQEYVHSDSLEKAIGLFTGLLSNNVSFALLSAIISAIPFTMVFRKQKMSRINEESSALNLAENFYALVFVSCQIMIVASCYFSAE